MKLFVAEEINISGLHGVFRYDTTEEDKQKNPVVHHGTTSKYCQLIFFLQGDNTVSYGESTVYDRDNSVRFLPGVNVDNYIVERRSTDSCIDIYFTCENPAMPKKALAFYDIPQLRDRFLKIYNLWQKKEPGYYVRCMAVFYEIINELKKHSESYISKQQRDMLEKSHTYITENYTKPDFSYKELSELSGFSYSHFKTLFKRHYGMSPIKYITYLRINRAKELLITGKYSVSDTALMCGFENVYYFSKVFKDITGVTPGKWGKN